MTDDKKGLEPQELDFDQATQMTVEEAVQKEADLVAGVTPEDGVLDKYIKKNREQVAEQKFSNKDKPKDLSRLDTSSLDNFIEKQRQELEETGVLPVLSEESLPAAPVVVLDDPFADTVPVAPVTDDLSKVAEIETFYGDQFTAKPKAYKNRKVIMGALAALLLTTVGLAYGLNQLNKSGETSGSSASTSSQSASSSSSSSRQADKADVAAFDDLYKTFFADEALTKPKNSEFDKLSQLEEALKKLEGTSAYEEAKTKYDSLSKAIKAIQTVNDQFETPAVVDGEKVVAKLKDGVDLNHLTASMINTGKANLDTLLQAVITEAKGLTGAGGGTTGSTPVSGNSGSGETQDKSEAAPAADKAAAQPAVETSHLQRSASRVPYNEAVIADSQNPAWSFTPGVLEEILRVSRERGYITGDNYILDPVNIINGNGYYNMFKPDGTYLFSINAKTGYFVGNGSGYADDLDY